MAKQNTWRKLSPKDSARITCTGYGNHTQHDPRPAIHVYSMLWSISPGISFFYHCDECTAFAQNLQKEWGETVIIES